VLLYAAAHASGMRQVQLSRIVLPPTWHVKAETLDEYPVMHYVNGVVQTVAPALDLHRMQDPVCARCLSLELPFVSSS
jgi:hypothetical protein